MNLPPVFQQGILQYHTFWQEKRKTWSCLMHHKQPQFPAQLSVISLFCLLHHRKVSFQFLFLGKRCGIKTRQHLIVFVSSPVRAGNTGQFISFSHIFCAHQMWSGAQIGKFSLFIKADFLAFW